jgi:hypothetical protein
MRAAAIDVNSGRALPWNPDVDGTVEAIAVHGNSVYLGGSFTVVGGQVRHYLAAVDRSLGAVRTSWLPNSDGEVLALAGSGGAIYAGGLFTNIGGAARNSVAALDTIAGTATSWDAAAAPLGGSVVTSIVTSGTNVIVGGAFNSIGGQPRLCLATIGSNGLATTWSADVVGGFVSALALSKGNVYVGGSFTSLGGQTRGNAGIVNASSGAVLAGNPAASGPVLSLAAVGDTVYAGGFFAGIGGATRGFVSALGTNSVATPWKADTDGPVYALVATPYNVYMGGDFAIAGGIQRTNFAIVGVGTTVTGVDDAPELPPQPMLTGVQPNPFARSTLVRFTLPQASRVMLEVLDVAGRRVVTLADDALLPAGRHEVEFSAAGLRPGLYLCRLAAGGVRSTTKLVHTR